MEVLFMFHKLLLLTQTDSWKVMAVNNLLLVIIKYNVIVVQFYLLIESIFPKFTWWKWNEKTKYQQIQLHRSNFLCHTAVFIYFLGWVCCYRNQKPFEKQAYFKVKPIGNNMLWFVDKTPTLNQKNSDFFKS